MIKNFLAHSEKLLKFKLVWISAHCSFLFRERVDDEIPFVWGRLVNDSSRGNKKLGRIFPSDNSENSYFPCNRLECYAKTESIARYSEISTTCFMVATSAAASKHWRRNIARVSTVAISIISGRNKRQIDINHRPKWVDAYLAINLCSYRFTIAQNPQSDVFNFASRCLRWNNGDITGVPIKILRTLGFCTPLG